jgi:hypothetical protein
MLGGFEQLKEDHFRGGYGGAFGREAVEGNLPVFGRPGGNGVGHDGNVKPSAHQVERRLMDAHVRFDAAKEDLPTIRSLQPDVEFLDAAATEAGFVDGFFAREKFGNFRDRRAQRFGDLLAPQNGNVEDISRLDQNTEVPEQRFLVRHKLGELALNVNDNQATTSDFEHSLALPRGRIKM